MITWHRVECFESTIYCRQECIDPISCYRLSFLIIGVQSTEGNLKLFFKIISSHFKNVPYYVPAKSLATVKLIWLELFPFG